MARRRFFSVVSNHDATGGFIYAQRLRVVAGDARKGRAPQDEDCQNASIQQVSRFAKPH
jgi:hypothetical protein